MLALALAGCRPTTSRSTRPTIANIAYVTNGGSGTVTILDVVNVRVDRELPVGQNPVAVAASPTRNEVYVVNSGTASKAARAPSRSSTPNTTPSQPPFPFTASRSPSTSTPPGKLAYVANSGSNSISVVDLKTRREIAVLGAGEEPVAAPHLPRRQNPGRRQPRRKQRQPHRSRRQ
jgi:YVTN family beta-propeller protein